MYQKGRCRGVERRGGKEKNDMNMYLEIQLSSHLHFQRKNNKESAPDDDETLLSLACYDRQKTGGVGAPPPFLLRITMLTCHLCHCRRQRSE